MWCPKCKNEYVSGITVCADCGSELVEELPQIRKPNYSGYENPGRVMDSQEEFMTDETLEDNESLQEEMTRQETRNTKVYTYVNNAERAEENRSSAVTLLAVGAIGIVAVILVALGVLPIPFNNYSKYMVTGVMGTMFLLFFIMGCVSFKNAKLFAERAKSDTNLQEQMKAWCKENLSADKIDEGLFEGDEEEEVKYFHRTMKLKAILQDKFMNLDDGFLEELVEELYAEYFDEN